MGRVPRAAVVLLSALVFSAPAAFPRVCPAGQADSRKELQRLKREMREKRKEIRRAGRKEQSVLAELEKIDRETLAARTDLADEEKRLKDADDALRGLEASVAGINRDLDGLRRRYALRLRALYKISRSGAALILLNDGPGNAVRQVKYLGVIAARDRQLMEDYGAALTRLAERQAELAGKREDSLLRSRAVEEKRRELDAARRRKAVLLTGIRREKGTYRQMLQEMEASSAGLWARIKAERASRPVAPGAPAPGGVQARTPRRNGRLPWPVEGQVLTRFGLQRHPQFGIMVFRRGIEIAAHEGQAVRAAGDGQVVYADWYTGFGKLMIIDQGNGLFTLYGNLSRLDLHKGDEVRQGQVIGLAGDTGSVKGSKLYFEVRRNGEAEDPLTWLVKR